MRTGTLAVICLTLSVWLAAGETRAAEAPPGGESQAQPGSYSVTADAVMATLNQALAWYRQAKAAIASQSYPGAAPLSRDGDQLATHVVERAFDAARASAALIAKESKAETRVSRVSERREEALAGVRRREAEIARLQARLRSVPQRARAAVERDLATARNMLELERVRLEFATKLADFAGTQTESDADLGRQIQMLQDALPELKPGPAAPPPPATVAQADPDGTWGLLRRLLTIRKSRSSLEALEDATAALKTDAEGNLGALRDDLRPTMRRLRELAENPDPSGVGLAEGQREFKSLLQRRQQLATVMLPLRQQTALLQRFTDSLQEWKGGLDRQTRQLLQGIALDFLRVGLALGIILTGALFWRIAVRRYVSDPYRQRLLMSARNVVTAVAIALVLIFHFTSELATLVTVLGFAAAGIAFALQTVIVALAGYFSMVAPNGIRVGDHVALQGPFGYVHGEVIDIGFVRMRLRELAGDPLRPTGRVVVFPNSVVFTGSFFKHPLPAAAAGAGSGRDQQTLDTVTAGSTNHPR